MKQYILAALAGLGLLLAISCTTPNPARRFPHMIADMEPFTIGTVEVFFDRLLSTTVHPAEAEVIFYPRLNAVALQFRHEFVTYRQFWDEVARRQFISALERYRADFGARNLRSNYRRTRAVYGSVNSRLEWETLRITRTRISYPIIDLGYRFRGESPFFTTRTRTASEVGGPPTDSVENVQIHMYFTRAQAGELASLFSQAFLWGLIQNVRVPPPEERAVFDEYHEPDR